jgi:hypothetical protein
MLLFFSVCSAIPADAHNVILLPANGFDGIELCPADDLAAAKPNGKTRVEALQNGKPENEWGIKVDLMSGARTAKGPKLPQLQCGGSYQ